jgi:hypothetical protein
MLKEVKSVEEVQSLEAERGWLRATLTKTFRTDLLVLKKLRKAPVKSTATRGGEASGRCTPKITSRSEKVEGGERASLAASD